MTNNIKTDKVPALSNKNTVQKQMDRQRVTSIISKVVIYSFLVIMAIIMLIPFYWMINTALKTTQEINESLTPTLFPQEIAWRNFIGAFNSGGRGLTMWDYLRNTLIVAIFSTLLGTIMSIFVAFALSRLNFKGKELLFTILLATMMIPGEMMVVSNFITISVGFGWYGSSGIENYYSMIIPFLVSIFHIYLLRQSFRQIPNELYYAAKVDGTSDWKYLWKVMVPIAKSSIITIVILKLMGSWNAYIWPNLVAAEEYKLITSWLRGSFVDDIGRPAMNYQMAATIMVTVPLLLVFIFFRKYIMSGVSRSGIKG